MQTGPANTPVLIAMNIIGSSDTRAVWDLRRGIGSRRYLPPALGNGASPLFLAPCTKLQMYTWFWNQPFLGVFFLPSTPQFQAHD